MKASECYTADTSKEQGVAKPLLTWLEGLAELGCLLGLCLLHLHRHINCRVVAWLLQNADERKSVDGRGRGERPWG